MTERKYVMVKMTEEEKEEIRKRATDAHLPMSRFLILQGLYGEFMRNDRRQYD